MRKILMFTIVLLFPLISIASENKPSIAEEASSPPYGDLFFPFAEKNTDKLAELLDGGADVNIRDEKTGRTLLHLVSTIGDVPMIEFFLKKGADIEAKDKGGITPLAASMFSDNYLNAMEFLIKNKAKVNAIDKSGNPIIHIAATASKVEAMQILLKHGVDINSKDAEGFSTIHKAAPTRNADVVGAIIKNGADVNIKDDKYGMSLLQIAIAMQNNELVEYLLEKAGADANTTTKNGMTPLHHVAGSGQYEIGVLLIKNGAKGNLKDEDGKIPLDYAKERSNAKMITLLSGSE